MNMILCSEPCVHQHDGCCGLNGTGIITNAALSPCRYFTPQDSTQYADRKNTEKRDKHADKNY